MHIKQPCYESTDLDPVVIEYEATVERIRKCGNSVFEAWLLRVAQKLPSVKAKVLQLRRSQPCPSGGKRHSGLEQ